MNQPNEPLEPSGTPEAMVVVGYDGSAQSGAAVGWAAAEAWRRRTRLLVSCVCDTSRAAGTPVDAPWPSAEIEAAQQLAAEGAELAGKAFPQLDVSSSTVFRHPAEGLIEQSHDAALLVLGASGHGNLGGTLFGSVAFAVIAHATCPVIVVRGDGPQPGPQAPVLVAVDDSDSCRQAISFAARTAADCGAPLTLVSAWQSVLTDGFAAEYWARAEPTVNPDQAAVTAAQAVLDRAAEQVRRSYPDLVVQTRTVHGPAVRALAAATGGAALLVAGARGRGGFAGLLLGSVSRGLALTALCPVAVVRGTSD